MYPIHHYIHRKVKVNHRFICADYDRMGRDIEMSGDIFTIETAFDELYSFT